MIIDKMLLALFIVAFIIGFVNLNDVRKENEQVMKYFKIILQFVAQIALAYFIVEKVIKIWQ